MPNIVPPTVSVGKTKELLERKPLTGNWRRSSPMNGKNSESSQAKSG
jgi:hypothetical protein